MLLCYKRTQSYEWVHTTAKTGLAELATTCNGAALLKLWSTTPQLYLKIYLMLKP